MSGLNPIILEWQNALSIFGIVYTGPKDGEMNQAFINAILSLEDKYKAYGQIFTGTGIKMSVSEAKKKFLGETLKPTEISTPAEIPKTNDLKIWEDFFDNSLPVVGKIYDGKLATTAKKLEASIGKLINKPMSGVIWNDVTKQFNTTPDDIKKALTLLEKHTPTAIKPAQFTIDQRIVKMSQILSEKK